MTAKQKAIELVEKFHEHSYNPSILFNTKEKGSHDVDCALIAVDEILKIDNESYYNYDRDYWEEVKKEIYGLR